MISGVGEPGICGWSIGSWLGLRTRRANVIKPCFEKNAFEKLLPLLKNGQVQQTKFFFSAIACLLTCYFLSKALHYSFSFWRKKYIRPNFENFISCKLCKKNCMYGEKFFLNILKLSYIVLVAIITTSVIFLLGMKENILNQWLKKSEKKTRLINLQTHVD